MEDKDRSVIFNESLVVLDIETEDNEEVLKILGSMLKNEGFVKDEYIDEVIKREREYPTGIQTSSIGVAIPHADIEFVNNASIAVGILKYPVRFQEMATNKDINVKIVIMLAIKEPNLQLTLLQKIVGILQDKLLLSKLEKSSTRNEAYNLINQILI